MRNHDEITQDVAGGRISDALRKYVGRGQRYSIESLSEKTGISQRSLQSYIYEGRPPGSPALLTLFNVLGPAFTSEVLSVCGQSARSEDEASPEYSQAMTAVCGMASILAKALEDGKIDHREQAELRPHAQALIESLQPIASFATTVPFKGAVA